ncbi:hypothetical protein J5N97_017026 [Dioscorea zingiberensis]|uniref:DUF4057 domain-containing protein n=1 Tax=Dioscorea zingiberensis TaxID=325984 RepID=A0A9D5HFR4_9LILI|nr:hypothetical protein J5N97_017026 [Dioscorea zingiberensis]
MERRKPNASTAGLLAWPETASPEVEVAAVAARPRLQPPDKVGAVLFGGQITEEEAESLLKRKPCSGPKLKEMTGSGIFSAESQNVEVESGSVISSPNNRTNSRHYQQAACAISQISFSVEESVSPKKPTTLAEVAKQRELSGSLEIDSDAKMKKQLSGAKCKELTGHDIFGPPPEITPNPLSVRNLKESEIEAPMSLNRHTSVNIPTPAGVPSNITLTEEQVIKTSKKIHNQKFQDLSGNDIFKEDTLPGSADNKTLSPAKLKEMSGSDIFADGKAATRDYLGGVRKPPGGGSSITLT